MQPHTVRHDPGQLLTDLARSHSTDDDQAVKLDRALAPVPQLNVHVGKQVVTGDHHHARCRKSVHDRHEPMVGQPLHYIKPSAVGAHLANAAFKPDRMLLVGGDGIPLDEFLCTPVTQWVATSRAHAFR